MIHHTAYSGAPAEIATITACPELISRYMMQERSQGSDNTAIIASPAREVTMVNAKRGRGELCSRDNGVRL
jgi:hypothetical protein